MTKELKDLTELHFLAWKEIKEFEETGDFINDGIRLYKLFELKNSYEQSIQILTSQASYE